MTEKFKVVVTDFVAWELDAERRVFGDLASVESLGAHHEDELDSRFEEADAVMMFHNLNITAKTVARLKRCKLIVRCGVGYDNIDYRAARARGIPVANVPDYGTEEVADSAIGLALSLTRGISLLNARLRASQGDWSYLQVAPLPRLRGRVFGIVGLGRIGGAAAIRAKALGMDVAYYDPYAPDGRDKSLGVRRVEELADLLGQVHILSTHCPSTPETRHIIDAAAIARMPRGSYLVNTARGAVVDTSAIPEAIRSGQLAGAAIDVLETEPPAANDPFIRAWRDPSHPAHDRVIVNPHVAFYSEEGLMDMRVKGAEACRRALLGQPLRNIVN